MLNSKLIKGCIRDKKRRILSVTLIDGTRIRPKSGEYILELQIIPAKGKTINGQTKDKNS